jgi:hypothetical protein
MMVKQRLRFWSTDKIVACGLVIMGVIAVTGTIAHQIISGTATGSEVPMAIVSGLTGFLGRGALTGEVNKSADSRPQQEVEYEERDEPSPVVIPENKGEESDVKNKRK